MPQMRYLLKLFVFERDSYFWKKHNFMFKFNFNFQNLQNVLR